MIKYNVIKSKNPDQCFLNIKNKFRNYYFSKFHDKDISDYQIFHFKSGKQILGSVVYRYVWQTIELKYIIIASNYRKQGIGTEMLLFVEKIAIHEKCKFINLETIYEEVLNFYKKHGFKIEYIREGYSNNRKRFYLIKNL